MVRIFTVLLQILAGVFSLRLFRITRSKRVWIFISTAVFMMAIQRSFSFYIMLNTKTIDTPYQFGEYITFYIAILMLFGIAGLYPLFNSLNKSNHKMEESENKYRTLLENLPQCIFLKHPDLTYMSSNNNFARDVGINPSEVQGKTDFDFFSRDVAERIRENDLEVFAHGVMVDSELEFMKDGETCFIHTTKIPLKNSDDEITGLLVVYCDITDQKKSQAEHEKLQEQMHQAQKLDGLGVLAGSIAHDFNNLLTGVLGNTYLAVKDLPESSPVRESIIEIENAANRAAELTNQMLVYSGRAQYMLKPVNLGVTMRDLRDLINASISEKIEIEFDISPNIPSVNADPSQIRQIILNLTTNAAEAIGENKGIIRIAVGRKKCVKSYLQQSLINIKHLEEGEYIYIQVADTGCGFNQEDTMKLFEPFHSTKFGGRGLGLAAVLGIARMHKAGIIVSSKANEGSTFTILLRESEELNETNKSIPHRTRDLSELKGNGTILLVDDERIVRQVAERLIGMAGFTVMSASNGLEAIGLYQRYAGKIDCVLLDMTMPLMTGEEVLRELRELDKDVKIILSSGYNEADVKAHLKVDKPVGFLQKPYSYRKLGTALHDMINAD